jgi:predicted metal-dependent hydrolase
MRKPLQFVLDFFTGGDHQPLSEPVPQAPAPSPAVPQSPVTLAGYTHPAANRHAQLQGFAVSYRFERSRRRSIGFVIGAEGLVVRAPSWVTLREVDAAVQEKAAWIVAKLQQFRQRQSEHMQQAIDWTHGADIPYLGGLVRLCVLERGSLPPLASDATQELRLSLPPGASAQQVREAAEVWFKKKARPLFEERLAHFAPQLGVQWKKLSLSSARTRWGSARSDGHIRLNWRLIHLPLTQIDYVVVHELAHLREMNHGPRFWDTVGGVMPDYRERRQQLRQSALATPED